MWSPGEILERRVVRRNHTSARARLDRHVANGHALFHREPADGFSAILDDVSRASADTQPSDNGENDVLRAHARREPSVDANLEAFRLRLDETLRGEDVPHLGRADAEGKRSERTVRARVAVTAYDSHSRLREAELWPNDVHDSLPLVAERIERDAEFGAILLQSLELGARLRIERGQYR